MLTIEQARLRIQEQVQLGPIAEAPLSECHGLVLADAVISSIDSPPFDKSMMDGYAVRSADVQKPGTNLRVLGEVTAGGRFEGQLEPGTAVRIMTGAPLPAGADAVIRIEETETSADGTAVVIQSLDVTKGKFIVRRGASLKRGEQILQCGNELGPRELGVLAELGIVRVPVRRRPQVAIIATGNELVPVEAEPREGEIRNSNETMLCAQVERAGGRPVPLGIARDNEQELAERISLGLEHDFVCLSGGVSAGVLDLVPKVLQQAGVREVFHKIDLRPGRPLWFGVREEGSSGRRQYIFGLPGNPVSSMVCFELFVREALRRWHGAVPAELPWITARWGAEFQSSSERTSLIPCRIEWSAEGARAHVGSGDWKGSFDLRGTVGADGLALIPPGEHTCRAGEPVRVLPFG